MALDQPLLPQDTVSYYLFIFSPYSRATISYGSTPPLDFSKISVNRVAFNFSTVLLSKVFPARANVITYIEKEFKHHCTQLCAWKIQKKKSCGLFFLSFSLSLSVLHLPEILCLFRYTSAKTSATRSNSSNIDISIPRARGRGFETIVPE